MDIDAHFGFRGRADRALLSVDRPPTLGIAEHHPAADAMHTSVLDGFVGRAEDQRRAGCPQQRGWAVHQNHAKTREPIRHTLRYYCLGWPPARAYGCQRAAQPYIVARVRL